MNYVEEAALLEKAFSARQEKLKKQLMIVLNETRGDDSILWLPNIR